MPEITFNTKEGQTVGRELMVAHLNTGTNDEPVWSPIGKRVSESDVELDWGTDTSNDILGQTWTTVKKPTKTQSFDPIPLDAGDPAAVMLWNLGIKEENAQALANMDMMIAHFYAGTGAKNFAERYTGCAVVPTRIGGEGGGNLEISTDVTYGGARILGTATKDPSGKITFAPDSEA